MSISQTNEAALEACIERHLTGGTSGAASAGTSLKEEPPVNWGCMGGW
jgi:hypothetical protein